MSDIPKPESMVTLILLCLLLLLLELLFHLLLSLLVLLYLLRLLFLELACPGLGAETHCELLRFLLDGCNRRDRNGDSVWR